MQPKPDDGVGFGHGTIRAGVLGVNCINRLYQIVPPNFFSFILLYMSLVSFRCVLASKVAGLSKIRRETRGFSLS